MRKMLLLDYNIESFKRLLKEAFPKIKSAHLTEAIARGLGFNSNAALLIALQNSKKPKIRLANFEIERFYDWLVLKDYEITKSIPDRCFEDVWTPIWIMSKLEQVRDNWFNYARNLNIPMVHIAQRTKYADVHWDYIAVNEYHEQKKFTREDLYLMADLVSKYNGKYGFLGISVFTGTIYRLKIEDAKIVADEIFGILHKLISEKVK